MIINIKKIISTILAITSGIVIASEVENEYGWVQFLALGIFIVIIKLNIKEAK